MPELRGTQTEQNLRVAFERESAAAIRYLFFAQKADVEGHPDVAALFRSIAEGETGHAFGHLEFLIDAADPSTGHPMDDTAESLESAVAGERQDHEVMYPEYVAAAHADGFDEIAEWFETLVRAEKGQADRFQRALDALG